MQFSFELFLESLASGLNYLYVTAGVALISVFMGILFGLIIAALRFYRIPVLSQFCSVAVSVYQGIPTLAALLVFNLIFVSTFNAFAASLGLSITVRDVDIIWVGVFAISLHAITIMSESFRGAFMSVAKTQFEASYAVGMSRMQALRRIILQQVVPVAIPGLMNNVVSVVKNTALISMIGITEVMIGSLIPGGKTYSFLEGYLAAALIYWGFTFVLERLLKILEAHLLRYKTKAMNY